MNRRAVLLYFLTLLLAGCGTARKAATDRGDTRAQQPVAEVSWPDDDSPIAVPAATDRRSSRRSAPVPAKPQPPVRPRITFSESESAHVRLLGVGVTQFPDLEIDLDALRGEFCYPYRGKFISDYGMRGRSMHTGIDIKAIPGDTIRAALPGVVRMSKVYSGYGNIVVVRHYNGLETVYSHNVRNLVKVNDVVESGDPLALAGRTGRATTEHLHFEVRYGGEHFDPKKFVDPNAMTLRGGKLYVKRESGRLLAYNTEKEGDAQRAKAALDASQTSVVPAAPVPALSVSEAVYHTVRSGDTMSAIARRYSTTVRKICDMNKISNPDKLRLGQKLRVK